MSQRSGRNPDRRFPAGHPQHGKPAVSHKPPRVPQISVKPRQTPGTLPRRNLLFLVRDYFSILFDLKFSRYLTVQLLPLLYVVLVIGGVAVIGQLVWDAFARETQRGLIFLAASPFAVLVWASACRATTEFLLVVFRMSEDVKTLAGIRPTIDRVGEMISGPNWLSRLLPFIKAYQSSRDEPPPPSTN